MKKKYIKPIITRIKLDPSQAMLVACIVGDPYFSGGNACYSPFAGTTPASCAVSVRTAKATVGTTGYNGC